MPQHPASARARSSRLIQALACAPAEVEQVCADRWQAGGVSGAPPMQVVYRGGWTELAAPVMPGGMFSGLENSEQPWVLLGRQAHCTNVRFALPSPVLPGGSSYQLRADIPIDLSDVSADADAWIAHAFAELRRLQIASPTAGDGETSPVPDWERGADVRLTSEPTDFLADVLTDLNYRAERISNVEVHAQIPSTGQLRRVHLTREGAWWRIELPLGTGDVLMSRQPMRHAVGLFVLRIAAAIRFARPFARALGNGSATPDTALMLGFQAYVPLHPTSGWLGHAVAALITAAQRFEFEIESLATEAILSHAYLATTGGAERTVSTSNP